MPCISYSICKLLLQERLAIDRLIKDRSDGMIFFILGDNQRENVIYIHGILFSSRQGIEI